METIRNIGIGILVLILFFAIGYAAGVYRSAVNSGAAITIDELRAAHRESKAIAEIASRQNRELSQEITRLRDELGNSLEESRELRKQIEGIAADNTDIGNVATGLEDTNRQFRELIEKAKMAGD